MRRLSDSELASEMKSAKDEMFDLRFKLATRQLKNYRALPAARRRMAKLLTVLAERAETTAREETASNG
jgi:large subunit ribosomal protein L29